MKKAFVILLIMLILILSALLTLSHDRILSVAPGNGDGDDAGSGYGPGVSRLRDDAEPRRHPNENANAGASAFEDNVGEKASKQTEEFINDAGMTVGERFLVPAGFERVELEAGSFGMFLRDFPLKPHGTEVRYYNGTIKPSDVHAAVLDIDVGTRDLQQCADAVIRLRAEYLFKTKQFEKIHFSFTSGFNAEYVKWMDGSRIVVSGNEARWVNRGSRDDSYENFRKYLDLVFAYAGTQSLSREMENIPAEDLKPGDVFLKGGFPGHCVIVMDMAENPQTGERIFIIAQSYMPAQDIHILKNPANSDTNPWYPLDFGDELVTPEWTFTRDQVYRFTD